MEKNQAIDDKKMEKVNGGIFPSVTEDGSFRIECPFCHAMVKGKTVEDYPKDTKISENIVIPFWYHSLSNAE